jgi:molecular chaperone DnaJ
MPGAQGGPSGDLYVDVDLAQEENWERHESDLVTRSVMPYAKAALGGQIELTLPDESTVDVDVPAGSQPGDVITVRGHGMPRIDGRGRGSLQIVVQVAVPKTVSARAKELLEQLDEELKSTAS